jgi:hypothetical protein
VAVQLELASELAAMVAEDQRIRMLPADGVFAHRVTVEQRMEARRVDVANTDRLRAIVEEFDWPGFALVGEQGAEHAWLLAQHADHQLDRQRWFLMKLETAVAAGDAPGRHAAYLTDRVAMNEGRPQTYGTQMADVRDGEGVPWPIADREHLDERRASAGLAAFAEYVSQWRGMT